VPGANHPGPGIRRRARAFDRGRYEAIESAIEGNAGQAYCPAGSPREGSAGGFNDYKEQEFMAGQNTMTFTDANFESEVLQSSQPVLVDFWADWCMPCKALGPTIDELASEYAGRVKIGKLNTEDNRETPVKYNVQAIPTVLIFKGGQVVQKFVGLTPKKEFQAALASVTQ